MARHRDPVAVSYRLSLHAELRSRACTRGVCLSRRVAFARCRASFCSVFRHARDTRVSPTSVLCEYSRRYFGIFPSGMSRDRNNREESSPTWRPEAEISSISRVATSGFAFPCLLPKARRMPVCWAASERAARERLSSRRARMPAGNSSGRSSFRDGDARKGAETLYARTRTEERNVRAFGRHSKLHPAKRRFFAPCRVSHP